MTEQEIFAAAIKLTGDQRAEFLRDACGQDEELRREVEALLSAHEETGGFLPQQMSRERQATELFAAEVQSGTVVAGRYKLIERIGEGGMGTVWLAEQKEPVRRRVAVKLVKPGMDSHAVLARFEAERQALAIMEHPNIAKVLDGGMTEQGRPYFAMELVRGIPVTEYSDQIQLSINERLELFGQICSAVQHAHQKGIIHRDLKPTNILVTEHDGRPVVKVIDFGLAKALHGSHTLTDMSLHTSFGSVMGTPLYMAPEQLGASALDVDTRADLYSLGVVLYELLTGSTPIERERLKEAAWDEIRRIVREEEPPSPSMRLSSSDSLPSLAARRHIEPARLTRLVRGELDWIIMKALEKDRNRRYETASSLGQDVQRYLDGDPVQAAPASRWYRLRKLARRHRGPVLAASLVFLALLVGLAGTMYGLVSAEREKANALVAKQAAEVAAAKEQVANEQAQKRLAQVEKGNEIITSIFTDLDIEQVKEGTQPLEAVLAERLVKAADQLVGESVGDPVTVAQVQNRLGESLLSLGYPNEAISLFAEARATFTAKLGAEHPDTLTIMSNLALAYQDAGKLELAVPLCEETLQLRKVKLGAEHPQTLTSMSNLALAYQDAGKLELAVPLFAETLKLRKVKRGAEHPDTLTSMNNLAVAYWNTGKLNLALPLLEETLKLRKASLGAEHPHTLTSMNNLALAYRDAGKLNLALPLFEETLKLQKAKLGAEHPHTILSMNNLAMAYQDAGKLDLALPLFEETLKLQKAKLGAEHPHTLTSMNNLAGAYAMVGRFADAAALSRERLAIARKMLPPESPQLASEMALAGMDLLTAKSFAESETICRECLAIREKAMPDSWLTFNTQSLLGGALFGQKKYAEAEPLLLNGYEGMRAREETIPAQGGIRLTKALERLVELYTALDQPDQVAKWRAELEQRKTADQPPRT